MRGLHGEVATSGSLELRREEDRVVRLVPGHPVPHERKRDGVRNLAPVAVVAPGRCDRKVAQVGHAARSLVLPGTGPPRSPEDREDHLDPVRLCLPDRPVVDRPVIGRIGRVRRLQGPPGFRYAEDITPVEVGPKHLDPQGLVLRERPVGAADRRRLVVDADEHASGCARRGYGEAGDSTEQRCRQDKSFKHGWAPFRGWATCAAGLPRDRSRGSSRGSPSHA